MPFVAVGSVSGLKLVSSSDLRSLSASAPESASDLSSGLDSEDDDDDDGGDDDDDGDDDGVYLLLQVHGNRLETLPESIKYLSKLKRLWVSDNQLEVRTFFVEL